MVMSTQDKTNYKNQYNKENYHRIGLYVKEDIKNMLEAHKQKTGESVNAYINRLIAEDQERDKGE